MSSLPTARSARQSRRQACASAPTARSARQSRRQACASAPLPAGALALRASLIPGAGAGLFAAQALPCGALLGVYSGEALTAAAFAARYPDGGERMPSYCYHQRADLIIDAADESRSSVLRFINSPHGTPLRANVRFAAKAEVRAARAIKAGEELLLSYGRGYKW